MKPNALTGTSPKLTIKPSPTTDMTTKTTYVDSSSSISSPQNDFKARHPDVILLPKTTAETRFGQQHKSELSNIDCEKLPKHSACLTGLGDKCDNYKKTTPMPITDEEDIELLVKLHNDMRSQVG